MRSMLGEIDIVETPAVEQYQRVLGGSRAETADVDCRARAVVAVETAAEDAGFSRQQFGDCPGRAVLDVAGADDRDMAERLAVLIVQACCRHQNVFGLFVHGCLAIGRHDDQHGRQQDGVTGFHSTLPVRGTHPCRRIALQKENDSEQEVALSVLPSAIHLQGIRPVSGLASGWWTRVNHLPALGAVVC
jgi:hypothetical protein